VTSGAHLPSVPSQMEHATRSDGCPPLLREGRPNSWRPEKGGERSITHLNDPFRDRLERAIGHIIGSCTDSGWYAEHAGSY
jgi:hypothetical protein